MSFVSERLTNAGRSGIEQFGLRPGDNHTHLKAAGEKFCSSTRGYDDAQTQQEAFTEDEPAPLSALKNEEEDKRQRRDSSLTKPSNNSQEIKIESGK